MGLDMEFPQRELRFESPRTAVHIKLTGTLWEALKKARDSGQSVSMTMGKTSIIQVGEQQFPFRANPVSLQDVIRVPSDPNEPCTEVAQVLQRIHVQREVNEAERQRVRLRGLEAESQRKGRTAQVLNQAPVQGGVRKVVNKTVVRSSTPPIQRPEPAQPPLQAARRPTPPPRSQTPPPSAPNSGMLPAAAVPKPKASGPTSKLGLHRRATPSPSPGPPCAPRLAVLAAQTHCSVRKVLIACIGNDKPKKPRLDQMLQDVSQQVGTFRFTKDDVSRILKDVAEFRAPGVYVLKEYVRRKDLEPMQKALTSPKSDKPQEKAAEEDQQKPEGKPVSREKTSKPAKTTPVERSVSPAPRSRSPSPAPILRNSSESQAAATDLNMPAREDREDTATGQHRQEAPASQQQPQEARQSSQPLKEPQLSLNQELEETTNRRESNAERLDGKPVKKKKQKKLLVAKAEMHKANQDVPGRMESPQPATKSAHVEDSRNGTDATVSEATNLDTAALRDSSWYEEFVREPSSSAASAIRSRTDFDTAHDKHELLYKVYLRLGNEISSFKRKYQASLQASEVCEDKARQKKLAKQASVYNSRALPEVKRMSTAFKCLHAELGWMETGLQGYCDAANQA